MKLELKHLAGYLPYELKVDVKDNYGILSTRVLDHYSIEYIKPILRPLSDLTKEIEVNGEKFVPVSKINEDFFWDYVTSNIRDIIKNNDYSLIEYLPKMVTDKLLEWHFDIHGLIKNNLAIDINEITNTN